MHRICNIYDWKYLKHWFTALENGKAVCAGKQGIEESGDEELGNAVKLLLNDCFPISIICIYYEKSECRILLTPLWKSIFNFLKSKRSVKINDRIAYFNDFTDDEQNAILNALITAIWIAD